MDRRMLMPILFGLLFILVTGLYASVFIIVPFPLVVKVIITLVVAAFAITMIYLIVQRSREIKEEDKDDLGKY